MRASTTINLHALPEQRDLINRAAALLGWSRSGFMLVAACECAQAVLAGRAHLALDDESFHGSTTGLNAPLQANPGLARLLAVKAPWEQAMPLDGPGQASRS